MSSLKNNFRSHPIGCPFHRFCTRNRSLEMKTCHYKEYKLKRKKWSTYQLSYLFGCTKISKFNASFVIHKDISPLRTEEHRVSWAIHHKYCKNLQSMGKNCYLNVSVHNCMIVKVLQPKKQLLCVCPHNLVQSSQTIKQNILVIDGKGKKKEISSMTHWFRKRSEFLQERRYRSTRNKLEKDIQCIIFSDCTQISLKAKKQKKN